MKEIHFYTELTDEALIDEFRSHSKCPGWIFDVLISRHYQRIFRLLRQELISYNFGNEELHKFTLSIFADVYLKIDNYDPLKGEFRPWVYGFAFKKCKDIEREVLGRRKHFSLDRDFYSADGEVGPFQKALVSSPSPQYQNIHKTQCLNILSNCIDKLKGIHKSVIHLRLEDMSLKEISQIMQAPYPTIKSRWQIALKNLKKCLEKHDVKLEDIRDL